MIFKKRKHRDWKSIENVKISIVIILLAFQFRNVAADYCEFGICSENQYCCGENKCCHKTVDMWYLWAAILLLGIVVFFIICIFISTKGSHKFGQKYLSYRVLANADLDDGVKELP